MIVSFFATAASRSTLSEKATSMMRSTPSGAQALIAAYRIRGVEGNHFRNDPRVDPRNIIAPTHGPDHPGTSPGGQLSRHGTDSTEDAMNQQRRAGHRTVAEDRPMSGNARDPQACTSLVADLVRQVDREVARNDRVLSSRAERTVGLCPIRPDPCSDPNRVDSITDRVEHAAAVAVRNDKRERPEHLHCPAASQSRPGSPR